MVVTSSSPTDSCVDWSTAFTPSVAFVTNPNDPGDIPRNAPTRSRAGASSSRQRRPSISIGRDSIRSCAAMCTWRTDRMTAPKLPWLRNVTPGSSSHLARSDRGRGDGGDGTEPVPNGITGTIPGALPIKNAGERA